MTLNNPAGKLGMNKSIDMEFDMNLYDELLHEMHLKEIREKINSLRLQKEAVRGESLFDRCLALIGKWMVLLGCKLCQRHQNAVHGSFLVTCQKS